MSKQNVASIFFKKEREGGVKSTRLATAVMSNVLGGLFYFL